MRVTFSKGDAIRFIGHLDVVRLWERALRRARLPLAYTKGFTPHPRLAFAAPLALGATAGADLLDLYLSEPVTPAALIEALNHALPPACRAVAASAVPLDGPSLMALMRWSAYQVQAVSPGAGGEDLPAESQGSRWAGRDTGGGLTAEAVGAGTDGAEPWRPPEERLAPRPPAKALPAAPAVRRRIDRLLAASSLTWQRRREGRATTVDLRPLILSLRLDGRRGGALRLTMVLRTDSGGSARPDEVCAALGLRALRIHRQQIGLNGEAPLAQVAAVGHRDDGGDGLPGQRRAL